MKLKDSRHEKFAQNVAKGRQPTKAYVEAGLEGRGKVATNRSLGLLAKPEVKVRIEELREEALAQYRLSRRELLDYLVDVILTPAGTVQEGGRLCQSFRSSKRRQIMRMPSKVKAAEMLAKLCGWLAPEKQEDSGEYEIVVTIAGSGVEKIVPIRPRATMLKNPRHENFAQGVASGKKQARAYEEAGYAMKPGNGRWMASHLIKDATVEGRVAELQREAEEECRINRQQLLDFLAAVMLTPASEVHEGHLLCQGFHRSEQGQFVQMPDKLKAAELVIKIHGWDVPEKFEHFGNGDRTITIGETGE